MKYVIINLSPRQKGTSNMLVSYFSDRLSSDANDVIRCDLFSHLKKMDVLIDKIRESDCIIMIGPCYVDSYPAETVHLLMSAAGSEGALHGQSLYGFIQGGMPYTHTHEHGIRLLENFAKDHSVEFKGGFVMGLGAMLNGQKLDKIIGAKKMVPAVNQFIEHIMNNERSSEELYSNAAMKLPAFVTKIMAAAMNRKIRKNFAAKGIDYKAKSPYSV